jgi:two-component system, NtrC family, response regulator AtoC
MILPKGRRNGDLRDESPTPKERALTSSEMTQPVWIAYDPASLPVLNFVEKVKDTSSTLLIQGESGTGKDLLANVIHHAGERRDHLLLKIDCSSLPSELVESELFGYEKGAFTGASHQKVGKLELAGRGTLVLDDISSVGFDTQAKLLRVLDERVFERLGGNESVRLEARIIVLSRQNLEAAVRLGSFRDDLYFRLSVIPWTLLPLRERVLDIPPLAEHFLAMARQKYGKLRVQAAPELIKRLKAYPFPGNVRELRNLLEKAVVLADSEVLTGEGVPGLRQRLRVQSLREASQEKPTLEELEKDYIAEVLEFTRGKKGRAASILGISRKTLLEKRKRYGLTD